MNSKLNVLFLAEELRFGGAETYFYKIENGITRDDINFYSAALNSVCYDKLRFKDMYYEYEKDFFSKFNVISRIVKEKNVNVLHANSLRLAIIGYMVKVLTKSDFKLVYTKHNLTILEKISKKLFACFVNKFVDVLLTVCESDKQNMINLGIKPERIENISNGIDLSQFKFKSKYIEDSHCFNIGILARLSEEKNHKFFIDIMEKLNLKASESFKAHIAGDGVLRKELESYIIEKGLQDKVEMLGPCNTPEKFLEQMDCTMLVSTREVFPMTLLESMAVGSYVLSINVGGIKDCVVSGKTGEVVDEYNSDLFVDKLIEIMDKNEKNKEIILGARKLVEQSFDVKVMIKNIKEVYWR